MQKQFKSLRPACFQSESDEEPAPSDKTECLKYTQNSNPIQSKSKSMTIAYTVDDTTILTSEIKLHEKIELLRSKLESQEESDQQQSVRETAKRAKPKRYYQLKYCLRCLKQGHLPRNCTTTNQTVCLFCLDNHFSGQCSQITCQHCGEYHSQHLDGCNKSIQCSMCGMWGHTISDCNVIMNREMSYQDLIQTLCFICFQRGHCNCNTQYREDTLYRTQKSPFEKYKQFQEEISIYRDSIIRKEGDRPNQ